MREEYEFDKMKGRKNPYAKKLKKQITIRLDKYVIKYFKDMASENEMSYQTFDPSLLEGMRRLRKEAENEMDQGCLK